MSFQTRSDVLRNSHIRYKNIIGKVHISKNIDSYIVKKGDMLFTRTSETQDEIGISSVYIEDSPIVFGGFIIRGRPPKSIFDIVYSGYAFRSPIIRRQIISLGQGGIHVNIGQKELEKISVPIPSLQEQQAIAAALSDVDELLSSLDQLIAKKKDIRLATMHELLTGKTRLPGFQEKWREKSVDEVSELGHKRIVPSKTPHCHMCIELEHIVPKTGKLCGFSDGKFISSIKSFFDEQSILFGKLRAYLQKFWYAKCSGACSTEIWVLNAKRNIVVPKFLYYAIQTKEFIEASSITYGTHMPRSDWNMVKDVILSLPPSLAEQQAIAAVLSDMDTEIEALEARRDKVRHIKAGMMQELLTGKTRLISSGEGA